MRILWEPHAWDDYQHWVSTDKKILKRLNQILKDTLRHRESGLGKPEKLKHQLAGYFSRRITREHRLVYTVKDDTLIIVQCRYHY